jgi:hypothetical protein
MSVLKQYNQATSQWEAVVLGKQGPSGTVAVSAPLTNSGTSTAAVLGLDYSAIKYGQNAIINGAFDIWQRGTSFTNPANTSFAADRWKTYVEGSGTVSRQAVTPGSISGYEFPYYLSASKNSGGSFLIPAYQFIEDARTFAGQTVTLSFWAKASSSTITYDVWISQVFGTGGSTQVTTLPATAQTLTTAWVRYSHTFTMPSISGKTIGADSFVEVQPIRSSLSGSGTIDIAGVQFEAGSVATPFKRAGGTIQGELAACQRYYWRASADSSTTYAYMTPYNPAYNGNTIYGAVQSPVTMRRSPTSVEFSGLQAADGVNPAYAVSSIVINNYSVTDKISAFQITTSSSGLTQYRPYSLRAADNAGGYLGFSAEL